MERKHGALYRRFWRMMGADTLQALLKNEEVGL